MNDLFRVLLLIGLLPLIPATSLADHPTISLERGSPGPITTTPAIPLPEGTFTLTTQGQFIFNDEISDAALSHFSELGEDIHSTERITSLGLNGAFGLTENITLGFGLPYIWRINLREAGHHDEGEEEGGDHDDEGAEEGSVERLGDSHGLGDLALYTQIRILNDEDHGRHASLIAGLKTPTGRTNTRTLEGERFETEHQPGSGSWDPITGFAVTQQAGRFSFDASVLYWFVSDGSQNTNLGDIFNYNFGVSYRVLGATAQPDRHDHADDPGNHEHHDHRGPIWDLILEANGDWRDRVEVDGIADANTGGNIVYLSLGTRLAFESGWSATVSAGLPVETDLNGAQSEPNFRLLLALSKGF